MNRPGFSIGTAPDPPCVIANAIADTDLDLDIRVSRNLIMQHLISQRSMTIVSATRVSNVTTIVTLEEHGWLTGQDGVIIAGVTPVGATVFNGTFDNIVVDGVKTFHYADTATNDTGAGGTAHVAAAGYVELVSAFGAVDVTHHTDGENIKTEDATASYMTLFLNVAANSSLKLHVTEGIHNIYLEGVS